MEAQEEATERSNFRDEKLKRAFFTQFVGLFITRQSTVVSTSDTRLLIICLLLFLTVGLTPIPEKFGRFVKQK